MINRRSFLYKTSLGLTSLLFVPAFVSAEFLERTLDERLYIAAQKRKQGRLNQAINKFTSIIEDYPEEIRAYDGLRKTLLLRKYNELAVLELYQNGLSLNPNNKNFKERLAKEYMRLALGNKKFTNQLNMSESLLIEAKRLFRELKNEYPENTAYQEQWRKVRRKINQQADYVDARGNTSIKEYKKDNKRRFRKRFRNKSISEVEEKLNELLEKPQNNEREKHIKELYKILIKKSRQDENLEGAFLYARAFYDYDKLDSRALQLVKRFAKKTENYGELIDVAEENHTIKQNFWSKLSWYDAYFLRYKKTQIGDPNSLSAMLDELEEMSQSPEHRKEFLIRKIKLGFKFNQIESSKDFLEELGNGLLGTKNLHNILLLSLLSARYYKKSGQAGAAVQVLDLALGTTTSLYINDTLSSLLFKVVSPINFEKEQHIERLTNLREKILNHQIED